MASELIDDRSTHRNYPKPNPNNLLEDDAARIAQATEMIDQDVKNVIDHLQQTDEAQADHEARLDALELDNMLDLGVL